MQHYSAINEDIKIEKDDKLNFHGRIISLLYKAGHYDILYSNEVLLKLEVEKRIDLLIYDNDMYEIYQNNSILEDIITEIRFTTECCKRATNKHIYNKLCLSFKGTID